MGQMYTPQSPIGFGAQNQPGPGTAPQSFQPGRSPSNFFASLGQMLMHLLGGGQSPHATPQQPSASYGSQNPAGAETPPGPPSPTAAPGAPPAPTGAKVPPTPGNPTGGGMTPPPLGPLAQRAKDRLEAQQFEHQYQLAHIQHFQALQQLADQNHAAAEGKASANNAKTSAERASFVGPKQPGTMTVGSKTFQAGEESLAASASNDLQKGKPGARKSRGADAAKFQTDYEDSQRNPNLAKRGFINRFRQDLPTERPLEKDEQDAYDLLNR